MQNPFNQLNLFPSGELDVAFLYLSDTPLAVDLPTFTYWFGGWYGLSTLALMLVMPALKRAGATDVGLCVAGLVSKAAGLCLLAFSTRKFMIFIGGYYKEKMDYYSYCICLQTHPQSKTK